MEPKILNDKKNEDNKKEQKEKLDKENNIQFKRQVSNDNNFHLQRQASSDSMNMKKYNKSESLNSNI